jgi:hypothetical protein
VFVSHSRPGCSCEQIWLCCLAITVSVHGFSFVSITAFLSIHCITSQTLLIEGKRIIHLYPFLHLVMIPISFRYDSPIVHPGGTDCTHNSVLKFKTFFLYSRRIALIRVRVLLRLKGDHKSGSNDWDFRCERRLVLVRDRTLIDSAINRLVECPVLWLILILIPCFSSRHRSR